MVRYGRCYVCDSRHVLNNLVRIFGNDRVDVREIAIAWREDQGRADLNVTENTRICNNCYQRITQNIRLQQDNVPLLIALQLNVLVQENNNLCLFCQNEENVHRLSLACKAEVFIKCNIFIPQRTVSCNRHLDYRGHILRHLLAELHCVNRQVHITTQYFQKFFQEVQIVGRNLSQSNEVNDLSEVQMTTMTSLTKQQFEVLFTYCDPVQDGNVQRRICRKELLMFLCKLRQGCSDEFLTTLFNYDTRQATSTSIMHVRISLMNRFVPENLGLNAITRNQFINEHVTPFANALYNSEPARRKAIVIIDSTYTYCHKTANFRALRQSFCLHKGRHLIKPALMVGTDGYILDVQGPYFSDAQNNDAAMLIHELENDEEELVNWFQEDDIIIVDRGYRDVIDMLEALGLECKMPPLLEAGENQFDTEDANDARLITKFRWMVESRNGHLKSIFKLLGMVQQIHVLPNVGDYYRIGAALINRFRCLIHMQNNNIALAERMLRRAQVENHVQNRVIDENLATRNAQRWVRLDAGELDDFPALTIDFLRDITFGVYQVQLAPSYIQDTLQRLDNDELEIEMLANENRLPEPGFLRARIFSRFRNRTKYQLWIQYVTIGNMNRNPNQNPITGYYCTCIAGARTLGTCAHIASVLWYLGFARNRDDVHYPSHRLINEIEDAGDRPPQEDPP